MTRLTKNAHRPPSKQQHWEEMDSGRLLKARQTTEHIENQFEKEAEKAAIINQFNQQNEEKKISLEGFS